MIYLFFIFFFINLFLIYLFKKFFKTNIIRSIISLIFLSRLILFSCIIFQPPECFFFSWIFILKIFFIENLISFIIRLYTFTNSLVFLLSLFLLAKFKSQILFFENPNTSSCPSFFNISKCLFKIMVFLHIIVCLKLSIQIKNSFLVMISELF